MPPKRGNSSKSGGSSSNKKQLDTPTGTVLQLTFTSMEKMAAALARISAYIEDPEYEGIPIMLGQIDEVDIPAKRYAGHNFPLESYDTALQKLGMLSPEEKMIQRAIAERSKTIKPRSLGYIIAYVTGDERTCFHETMHAVYFFNPEYRQRVQGIWQSITHAYPSWAKQFSEHLGKSYCERVHVDEFQAIISSHEYECVPKIQQLVHSIIPKQDTPGFTIVDIGTIL